MSNSIKLLRPNPKKSKSGEDFFKKVIDGDISFGDGVAQLQVMLGAEKEYSIEEWVEAVQNSSLLVILKNLNSLIRRDKGEEFDPIFNKVTEKLSDKDALLKSRVLPFRVYSAYKALEKSIHSGLYDNTSRIRKLLPVISDMLDNSMDNLQEIKGSTVILIDNSGSMYRRISDRSEVEAIDIAALLGAISYKKK